MSNMRVKDASFIQQHIEKLILAGGILVLVAAVFLFVMGNPFGITMGNRTYDTNDEPIKALEFNDTELQAGLQNQQPLGSPGPVPPDFLQDYSDMLRESVLSGERVAQISASGLHYKAIFPDETVAPRYASVYPPVPGEIEHVIGADVLDTQFNPEIVNAYFELLGGAREPADFTMFIASGEFPLWDWVTRLQADPEVRGEARIPQGIWDKRFGIAGVLLLREEYDPITGEWGNPQIVSGLPGQMRYLPTDSVPANLNAANPLYQVQVIQRDQEPLARPELPWLDGPVQAIAPGGDQLNQGAEGFDEFGQLLSEENLGPTERRVRDLQEQILAIQEAQQIWQQRQQQRNQGRPGTSPDADRPPRDDAGSERRDPYARRIERIQGQIAQLQPRAEQERAERERLAQERAEAIRLREERRALYGDRGPGTGGPGTGGPGGTIDGLQLEGIRVEEGATVRVWAADPTMRPGMTYRYKLLVSVINPLYAVPGLEPQQLEENRERIAILPTQQEIDDMQWIGPVTVPPDTQFFFTTRNQVEVYRRVNGEQKKYTFDVEPGNPIGGMAEVDGALGPIEVDLSVGAILIDIEQRTDIRGTNYYVMIFMDENGRIHERIRSTDPDSPIRDQLEDEIRGVQLRPLRPAGDAREGFDDFGDEPFFGPTP